MRLRDYLTVPYKLEAETIEVSPGSWFTRVSYPELQDCIAEAPVVEDALQHLERLRIEMIVIMYLAGQSPPVPRPPLQDCDPTWVAEAAGLPNDVIALIDADGPPTASHTVSSSR
ncbi:MAG: hypothetical protein QOJ15_6578 [Bradyrhizobium sp.]|nr:hypothetical protein [Bradyrhizobium sp.]